MSRGSGPLLLTMALSAPGAANALGLGDLHIDSKLNQPLSAHIDIVGATETDLTSLRATVADRETFQQLGSDRPAFLSSAEFQVTRDRQRRPILSVRSKEPFTEPLISFLIDLRWPGGTLVREYTLLLDPATAASEAKDPDADSQDVASDQASSPIPAAQSVHKVRANETLHGIARQFGPRSASDVRRMMMAIYRENPTAFEGNINRLHRDAELRIPTDEQIAVLSKAEATREFRAQMTAWRIAGRPVSSTIAAATPAVAAADPAVENDLERRIQALERSLGEARGLIDSDNAKLRDLQRQAQAPAPLLEEPAAEPETVTISAGRRFAPVAGVIGSILGLFMVLRFRRGKSRKKAGMLQAAAPEMVEESAVEPVEVVAPAIAAEDETIVLDTSGHAALTAALDPTVAMKRDESLEDLEKTAQYVYMPSDLNGRIESKPFVERRTSLADVLRSAIDREPHRRELKMKLLELYYTTVAANQSAFLEVAKALARDRDFLATGDWDQVAKMGRTINPNDPLFLVDANAGEDLSDVEESAA